MLTFLLTILCCLSYYVRHVMSSNNVKFLFDLEVLHDLPHVLDGHDDEGGGAE